MVNPQWSPSPKTQMPSIFLSAISIRFHPGVGLREARILAEFARKYQVDALEFVIARYLTDAIEDDPVGVYAIVVTYRHKDIGAKAARATLKLPISRLQPPQVQCITAELYGELIQYHIACGKTASYIKTEVVFVLRRKAQTYFDRTSGRFAKLGLLALRHARFH
ncbi:hypothetical protein BJV78DRAFT_572006 [Lactifluus subvellereus]|nr:hypothetical protein BJV78DRAFT_572006 [Lactifluus subvellereus]